jgi:hypothetical protein
MSATFRPSNVFSTPFTLTESTPFGIRFASELIDLISESVRKPFVSCRRTGDKHSSLGCRAVPILPFDGSIHLDRKTMKQVR